MFYEKTDLANGITVLTERMEAVRSVSLGIWFRVGSRDEDPEQSGISHFMEHMMFKGTPSRDALAISQEMESLGAEQNAFTSKEYTCYYARFVDEKLERVFEILGDQVTSSLFAQGDIDSEREVVIEEIARNEDTPDDHIFDLFTQALFPTHPLGRPILGTRGIVGAFTHTDCKAYQQAHYHANNCVVVASGSVDHAALVALCERYLSALPQGLRNERGAVIEPARPSFSLMQKDTEQAHLLYGMPGVPLADDDRFAATLLDIALGGGMSSRLFQEIREKRGLAYAVYASTVPYINAAQFSVYVGTRPANVEEAVGIIHRELARALDEGLAAEELERMRDFIIGHLVLSLESTSNRMLRLGKAALGDTEQLSLDELIERYRAVTLADIGRVAARVLSQQPTLAIISPLETSALEQAFAYLAP